MLELLALFIFTPLSRIAHECLDPVPCCTDCRLTHRDCLHFLITKFIANERHPFIQCPHFANILPRHLRQFQKVYLDILGQPMCPCLIIKTIRMMKSR